MVDYFYILVTCDNYSDLIDKDVKKILPKDVKYEFESTYGVYDAVLKIEMKSGGNMKQNGREIAEKIKSLSKVHTTMVLNVSD